MPTSDNPLLKRLEKNSHGQKAERKTGRRLGGRMQPGSGSKDHSKGDVVLPDFLLENKATINDSFSIRIEWLRKISKEAAAKSLEPALAFQFVDGHGRPVKDGSWVAVSERVFRELTEK